MADKSFASLDVTFDRVASFANRARNKPFVLQGGEGVAATVAFQKQLHEGLKANGLGKWAKPYTPHVTLLYDNQQVPEQMIEPITWRVEGSTTSRMVLALNQPSAPPSKTPPAIQGQSNDSPRQQYQLSCPRPWPAELRPPEPRSHQ